MRRTAAHTLVLLALAALWGCDEGAQAQDDARASQESAELASDDGSLTLAEAGLLLGSVPLGGAAPAEGSWSPPGCASSSTVEGDTALEATTTWTLSGCTGPYGVGSVDGTLVVETSSAEGGVVTAQVTSQGLTLNRIELSLSASVTYDPGLRGDALQVESQSTGVGPFGHAVQRLSLIHI